MLKLEKRLQKEAQKAPKGALAAHTRACRMTHYESQIAASRDRLREMEANLTTRESKKRESTVMTLKSKAEARAKAYKAAKEKAEREAKKEVAKAKKETAAAKKAATAAKKTAKTRVKKPAKKAKRK
jgi:colicin import membrane protein